MEVTFGSCQGHLSVAEPKNFNFEIAAGFREEDVRVSKVNKY